MIFRAKLKAGVLLYALLMAAIFTLLLQFYLERRLASHQQQVAQERTSLAHLMATVAYDKGKDSLTFDKGQVLLQEKAEQTIATVTLTDGTSYQFTFTKPSSESESSESDGSSSQPSPNENSSSPSSNKTELTEEKEQRVSGKSSAIEPHSLSQDD